jgi:CheY-like chemotaxis protein
VGRTTILFVDDDALIRGLYVELLREEGFSVVEAGVASKRWQPWSGWKATASASSTR